MPSDVYEPVSKEVGKLELRRLLLKVSGLEKTYENGFKAVNGINLKMYSGQIFALLGHNGAGKSTTISMLTGLFEATAGAAEVFGINMFEQMDRVRQIMGVCPQHDVLFELLTPEEHLDIFYDFKGADPDPVKKQTEIDTLLRDVGVDVHRKKMSKTLSGGNKRKLSVAIALCGGSKLVMLDEPTAGMDLSARRSLWNMLKNYRRDRIIILTTHYMDEADILGDRIGIMAAGKIVCLGTSLFLKNRFGVGYNLTMVKNHKENNEFVAPYLKERLGDKVKMLSEVASEITFQIPTEYAEKFKDFFVEFDTKLADLDLESYGVSVTTLEEVFLRVTEGVGTTQKNERESLTALNQDNEISAADDNQELPDADRMTLNPVSSPDMNADHQDLIKDSTFGVNMNALFTKRLILYKRNWKGLCCEIFVPLILVIFGLSTSLITFFKNSPNATIQPDVLPLKQNILMNTLSASGGESTQSLFDNLPDQTDSFEWTQTTTTTNDDFYNEIFNTRLSNDPVSYGSYLVYLADAVTFQYQVTNYVNITSQDVTGLYPQFLYEAILKDAIGSDFNYTVVSSPYPLLAVNQSQASSSVAFILVFVIAIGFALLPASIIAQVLNEVNKNLKQIQLVSGMRLSAYWLNNYCFDILKTFVPVLITIGLTYAFNAAYEAVWLAFLLFPFAVIPFTYVTSFMFDTEVGAQISTIFLHFLFMGIAPIVTYTLRVIPSTAHLGDILRWVFCIEPSYCLTQAILISSSGSLLALARQLNASAYEGLTPISQDPWSLQNVGGDCIIMGCHFVVWTLVLALIETGAFKRCRSFTFRSSAIPAPRQIEMDDDVLEEE